MQSGFLKYNHGPLFYQINKPSNSQFSSTLVFLHGFSMSHKMWDKQIRDFSKDHRVISYDLRGFGRSTLPEAEYSHHDDLAALLNHVNTRQIHLIGLSLGGEVAIDFAITHPGKVLSLTLLSSSLGGYRSTVDWDVHAKEQGVAQAKKNWLQHEVFNSLRRKPDLFKKLQTVSNSYSGWHWLHKDPRNRVRPSARQRLHEIKAPTQIMVGEDDLSYYHDIAQILLDGIEDASFHEIKDAGHMINWEQPEIVNRLIKQVV